MKALEIHNLVKIFKTKKGQSVHALNDLSFDVMQGEVFGFLGPNGAGKSTTIKTLVGLITPSSGNALINGVPVSTGTARLKVGYLPENPAFYDYLTPEEYLTYVARSFLVPVAEVPRCIEQTLKLLELWDARKRQMRSFSKGMVQRVGLAQVLVHDPDIYILDEPMSGLDPLGRSLVKNIILELKNRGKTVFFSTHITDDVEKVCDRVGIIVKGSLVAVNNVENLLKGGVEGYLVSLQSADSTLQNLAPFSVLRQSGTIFEYYIPKDGFNRFMELVIRSGSEVVLVETRRKNLEDYFLSLVK